MLPVLPIAHRRYCRQARWGHSQGFSLLEVLVAFAILALSLGVVLQIFSSGTHNVIAGSAYSRAADLAESVLALAGTTIPIEPGVQSGDELAFHWELEITPYGLPELAAPPQGVVAYLVTARVSWTDIGRERRLVLQTLRTGPRG
jgi:general secretion pathway protein I